MKFYWVNYTARDSYGNVAANGNIVGRSEKLNIECMENWILAIADKVKSAHSVSIDGVIPLPDEEAK